MNNIIKYNETLSFKGRNGIYQCAGLEVYDADPNKTSKYSRIVFEPITSKGTIGSCFIDFPKNKIQDLINKLEKLK